MTENETLRSRLARKPIVVAPGISPRHIRSELRQRIDPTFLPRPIRLVDELPRNANGKVLRRSLV